MSSQLFSYQEAVIPEVLRSLRPDNPTLLVSPTGSGKTVMAAEIALNFRTVLFVAHRIEIVEQARAEMGHNVQCMSIHQALHHGPPNVDLLIIDEAHRSMAKTYLGIIEKYPEACVLGLTATPHRTDGQGLIDAFDEIVECSNVKELVESGHLVPYQAFEAPDEALKQLPHMKRERGDYATRELSALMNKPRLVGDVVREYKKHGIGRKAIAFAVSVEHSKALTNAFTKGRIRAAHLDGRASKTIRSAALKDLAEGRLDVLCNVNLFTEGWDCPSVSCVIMARPTASLTLYLQSVGRGMRTSPGKTDLLILDHAGNIERHGEPDEQRAWSLESEAQKEKREKEVAELERLHALGFDSIEAELEARRREREETYSASQCRELLNLGAGTLRGFLRRHGVRYLGSNLNRRYLKEDIDAIRERLADRYSQAECMQVLGLRTKSRFENFKTRHHIKAIPGLLSDYSKSEIQAAVESEKSAESNSLSATEARSILGLASSNLFRSALQKYRIRRIPGARNRYAKSEIYSLKEEFDSRGYSGAEVTKLLGFKGDSQRGVFLRKNGISRIPGSQRYAKNDIDNLKFVPYYRGDEVKGLFGLKDDNAWIAFRKRHDIRPIDGHVVYSRSEIDRLRDSIPEDEPGYSGSDVNRIFGLTSSEQRRCLLKRHGVKWNLHWRHFPKREIDTLKLSLEKSAKV